MVRSIVDYRLLIHHNVRNRLLELAADKLSQARLDKELDQLASLGDNLEWGAFTLLAETQDEHVALIASNFLMKLPSIDVIDPAVELLHDPRVTDVVKAQLLRVLSHHGWDIHDLMSPSIFHDVHKLAMDSMEQLLKDLHKNHGMLGNILEEFGEFAPEMQLAYVQDLASLEDVRVIPILEALGRADDEVIAAEAIRALGSLTAPESLSALLGMVSQIEDSFLAELLAREIKRLRFKGIEPSRAQKKVLGEVFSFLVTGLDGKGSRIVWVARYLKGSRGRIMAVSFLVSTEEGLKDCYGSTQLTKGEAEDLLKSLRERYPTVDNDLEYAHEVLKDALYTSRANELDLPPQWSFWQSILQPLSLKPEPFQAEEGREVGLSASEQMTELMDLEELSEWYEEDPLIYDAAEEMLRISKKFRSRLARTRATEDLLDKLAAKLYQPRLGDIIRRLDLTADFLQRRGKGSYACTLDNITRSLRAGEPPEHNAFLRKLVSVSLKVAEHNLRAGYDIRRNPEFFD